MNSPTCVYLILFVSLQTKCTKVSQNFSVAEIRNFEGTLHYDTLSQLRDVSKLKIINSHITHIETGALCAAPSLKSLELNFAAIPDAPTLTQDVFHQCNLQMKELFVRFDYDHPSKIERNALEKLNLSRLALECLKIGHLQKNFLKLNRPQLKTLVLSSCHIHTIDEDFFEELYYLEEVEISYNKKLKHLPKNLFINTPKLKRLLLKRNGLRELTWDEFYGLRGLQELDLQGNRQVYFDAEKIAEMMPNLKKIDIRNNLLPCRLKEVFAGQLVSKLNYSIVAVKYSNQGCKTYL